MREGEEAVTQVQKEYRGALAEVEKLVEERQRWQEAWDEERQRLEADKAALVVSMDVSCHLCLCCHSAARADVTSLPMDQLLAVHVSSICDLCISALPSCARMRFLRVL